MSFSNYLAGIVLDEIFGVQPMPTGDWASSFIALSSGVPQEDGSNFLEPSPSSGYQRVVIPNTKNTWSVATGTDPMALKNSATITFPVASLGSWGTISGFGLFNLSGVGSGTGLAFGTLTTPKSVAVNDTASFASGDFVITLD